MTLTPRATSSSTSKLGRQAAVGDDQAAVGGVVELAGHDRARSRCARPARPARSGRRPSPARRRCRRSACRARGDSPGSRRWFCSSSRGEPSVPAASTSGRRLDASPSAPSPRSLEADAPVPPGSAAARSRRRGAAARTSAPCCLGAREVGDVDRVLGGDRAADVAAPEVLAALLADAAERVLARRRRSGRRSAAARPPCRRARPTAANARTFASAGSSGVVTRLERLLGLVVPRVERGARDRAPASRPSNTSAGARSCTLA